MKGDKRVRWFFRIRDAYFARSAILMVKRAGRSSIGKDGVARQWVITLSPDVAPDPKYRNVWASDEEAHALVNMLEEECGKLVQQGLGELEKPF
jgi:hypothetical protein